MRSESNNLRAFVEIRLGGRVMKQTHRKLLKSQPPPSLWLYLDITTASPRETRAPPYQVNLRTRSWSHGLGTRASSQRAAKEVFDLPTTQPQNSIQVPDSGPLVLLITPSVRQTQDESSCGFGRQQDDFKIHWMTIVSTEKYRMIASQTLAP